MSGGVELDPGVQLWNFTVCYCWGQLYREFQLSCSNSLHRSAIILWHARILRAQCDLGYAGKRAECDTCLHQSGTAITFLGCVSGGTRLQISGHAFVPSNQIGIRFSNWNSDAQDFHQLESDHGYILSRSHSRSGTFFQCDSQWRPVGES